jgi:hypothetical protein
MAEGNLKKIKSLGVSKPKDINMMVYYGWRKSKKIKSLGVSKPKDINMMVCPLVYFLLKTLFFFKFPSAIVNIMFRSFGLLTPKDFIFSDFLQPE